MALFCLRSLLLWRKDCTKERVYFNKLNPYYHLFSNMPNKCAIFNCKSNYAGGPMNSAVSFPQDDNLRQKWIQFVNRNDWEWSKHSVICTAHFEEKYIKRYKKKVLLDRKANPIPTIYSNNGNVPPSVLPNIKPLRKVPAIRIQQKDELQEFRKMDSIKSFQDLTASKCRVATPLEKP